MQAGAAAAFTVDLLVYPLDTLKTRIQSPDFKKIFVDGATDRIKKPTLFRGLYQGVGSVIIATLPSCKSATAPLSHVVHDSIPEVNSTYTFLAGAFFSTYEGVKYLLNKDKQNSLLPQPFVHAIASSTAELVSCAILTPAEVIKQNAQMVQQGGTSDTKVNATKQTLQRFKSNPLALWRGYTALAGRNLPFTALQFPMFERFKEMIKERRDRAETRSGTLFESGWITAISAGTAGSIAAVVTTPVDVVKTRIMLAAAETATKDQDPNGKSLLQSMKDGEKGLKDALGTNKKSPFKKSSMDIARQIVEEHGWKGLWRGGALRGVWTMLGSGLYLSVYESGRIYLGSRRGEELKEEDLF